MSRKRRQRRRNLGSAKRTPRTPRRGPEVHVKIAHADRHLGTTTDLIRPALLYADRVTVYSPAATMVKAVQQFASISDPAEQFRVSMELIESIPELRSQLDVDPQLLEQMKAFMELGPQRIRVALRMMGQRDRAREFDELFQKFSDTWEQGMPEALASVASSMGAEELLRAVEAGVVEVADLSTLSETTFVGEAVQSAMGDTVGRYIDELQAGFLARLVEMLTEGQSYPLLDASSTSLLRALEAEHHVQPSRSSSRRSGEISAAADFMSFLPYFPALPLDEVLDLRVRLKVPLIRFRAAMAEIAREFASRSHDPDFSREVEDAWRVRVEPSLQEIREALAEHGLLREVASVAGSDPRRIIVEAGGVLLAAGGDLVSVSGLMATLVAAGVPAIDVIGRALNGVQQARRDIKKNAFYFLHRLGGEAERRGRRQ